MPPFKFTGPGLYARILYSKANMMPQHEIRVCPKCQIHFECKEGSITICQCSRVITTEEERSYMRTQFNDCLCAQCMEDLKKAYHQEQFNAKLHRLLRK